MPPGLVPGEGALCGKLGAGMGTRRPSVLTQSRGLSQRDWRLRRRRFYLSRRGVHLSPEQAQCTAPLQYGNAVPARAGPGAGTRGMQGPRARASATGTREEDAARERATKAETRRTRRERKQRGKNRRRRRRTATRRDGEREAEKREGGDGERDQERKSWRQKTDKASLKRRLRPAGREDGCVKHKTGRHSNHKRRSQGRAQSSGTRQAGAGWEHNRSRVVVEAGVWAAVASAPWFTMDLCFEVSPQGGLRGAGPPGGTLESGPCPHMCATQVCPSRPPKPGFSLLGPVVPCDLGTVASRVPSAWPSGVRLHHQILRPRERTVLHPGPLCVEGTLEVCPQSPLRPSRAALVCIHGQGS